MDSEPTVTRIDLTITILALNRIVDQDAHRGVTIDEVHRHIQDGDVFTWLKERFRLSPSPARPEVAAEINEGLLRIYNGYAGDEGRRWGVRNNGICLLIAWVNELVQLKAYSDEEY